MTEEKIEPIQYSIMKNIREDEKLTYKKIGEKAIKDGKIAVCQMAGGQRNKTRTQWTKGYIYDKTRKTKINF